MDTLASVLSYAERGWAVVPVRPATRVPYVRWRYAALPTAPRPDWLAAMWARYPDAEVGILTGRRSGGLVVVDVDPKNGGTRPLDLPTTLTASTPSGGLHLYYVGQGQTNASPGLVGVDVRGEGGLVLAPPSPGREWTTDVNVAELPRGWGQRKRGRKPDANKLKPALSLEFAEAKLDEYSRAVSLAPEGSRNTVFYGKTKDALRQCRDFIPEDVILETMKMAAYEAGLNPDEVDKSAESALEGVSNTPLVPATPVSEFENPFSN